MTEPIISSVFIYFFGAAASIGLAMFIVRRLIEALQEIFRALAAILVVLIAGAVAWGILTLIH